MLWPVLCVSCGTHFAPLVAWLTVLNLLQKACLHCYRTLHVRFSALLSLTRSIFTSLWMSVALAQLHCKIRLIISLFSLDKLFIYLTEKNTRSVEVRKYLPLTNASGISCQLFLLHRCAGNASAFYPSDWSAVLQQDSLARNPTNLYERNCLPVL